MPLHKLAHGAEINYEVRPGLAPENILFIHGNLASNRWWYPAEEFWKKESQGKGWEGSLIYAEFRGCGESSAPQSAAEVDMHLFAEDFVSLIRSLEIKTPHLVGHSTGGLIAALMMAKSSQLFRKAVLLDPVGPRGVKFDPSMIGNFEQMKVDRNLTAVVMGSTIYGNNSGSDFFQNVLVEDAYKAVKSVGHLVLQALDGLDAREILKSVQNETLVLHGEHDQLLPIEDSRSYVDLLANAKFQEIKAQGHCVNVENPELFVNLIKSFLFH